MLIKFLKYAGGYSFTSALYDLHNLARNFPRNVTGNCRQKSQLFVWVFFVVFCHVKQTVNKASTVFIK